MVMKKKCIPYTGDESEKKLRASRDTQRRKGRENARIYNRSNLELIKETYYVQPLQRVN